MEDVLLSRKHVKLHSTDFVTNKLIQTISDKIIIFTFSTSSNNDQKLRNRNDTENG